jgi:peptidylprolyl isomerase
MNRTLAALALSSLVLAPVLAAQARAAEAAAAAKPAAPAAAPGDLPAPPDVAAPPADAVKTASGLATKVLQPGTGSDHPTPTSMVKIHYTGWTTDGKMFDSSVVRKKVAMFPVGGVIPGFSEALQLMVVGEKRRIWIPGALAYDNSPRQGVPHGMLVFDVEMLQIVEPPVTPPDVAAAPADAQVTKSGLASKVLQAGTGTVHPTKSSHVKVHYTGWTPDGKMFDSSVMRGAPATFGLGDVIAGWTEGLQLMVEGEKRRFWIPGKLAYDGSSQKGVPHGMLVFDVELIAIEK